MCTLDLTNKSVYCPCASSQHIAVHMVIRHDEDDYDAEAELCSALWQFTPRPRHVDMQAGSFALLAYTST